VPAVAALLARPGVRFLVVGGANTVLSFVVFRVALHLLGGRSGAPAAAQAMSYLVGVAVGYVAHRRLTFQSDGEVRRQLPRFLVVNAGMLAFTTVGIQLLVGQGGLPPTLTWIAVTGVATLVSFQLQRRVVFAAP
jgi:putative flippase GtrA